MKQICTSGKCKWKVPRAQHTRYALRVDDSMMYATGLTKHQGGLFILSLTLPKEYPFKPPTLSFKTKIYHPNVTNDDKGSMCLGLLRPDEWKPSSKLDSVLEFARGLLIEPQPDDAVEQGIAREYKENKKEYVKTAKAWVKQYAKK